MLVLHPWLVIAAIAVRRFTKKKKSKEPKNKEKGALALIGHELTVCAACH